jgi:hypothetical protein
MNMKDFVCMYLTFWGLSRLLRMILAFTIEQRSREITWGHTFMFILLQIFNTAMVSYFFIGSMSMNEDLKDKNENVPGAKVLIIAVVPFYFIAVFNFVEFVCRWFVLFWLIFVILEDYTDSIEKDRASILEMLMPGK